MEKNETFFSLIFKALHFAAEKHKEQRRKDADKTPYINHPIDVAYHLSQCCGLIGPEVLVAAVLHDTLEDTETSEQELAEQFGPEVLKLVKELTDDKSLPKAERKELQVQHAKNISYAAKLIKLADKISNVTDITYSPPADWDLARRIEYLSWAERVVNELGGINRALEELFANRLKEAREKLT
jgi:guanosine-3',5'-bis(diphosphate) 3'-pyrophosphohydrolase